MEVAIGVDFYLEIKDYSYLFGEDSSSITVMIMVIATGCVTMVFSLVILGGLILMCTGDDEDFEEEHLYLCGFSHFTVKIRIFS